MAFGDFFLKIAAYFAGFDERQLGVIERSMPTVRKLVDLVIQAQPLVQKAQPEIEQLIPLVQEAMKYVPQASEEFQTLGPALNILISVIEKDLATGQSREEAIHSVTQKIGAFWDSVASGTAKAATNAGDAVKAWPI